MTNEATNATPVDRAFHEDLATVLGGLLAAAENGATASFQQLASIPTMQRAVNDVREKNYDQFFYTLLYPIEQVVDGLLSSAIPGKRKARFIFKHGRFIESHLSKLIVKYEGSACSHDKVCAIMERLLNYYLTGKEIAFDWTAEYTFHYPKTIFTTHEVIVEFFQGLYDLYYGNPDKYLVAIMKVVAGAAASPSTGGSQDAAAHG